MSIENEKKKKEIKKKMELKKGMFVYIENEKGKKDFLCLQKTKTRKKKTKECTVTVIIATFVPKVKLVNLTLPDATTHFFLGHF